jgi:hypothetical protein
MENGQIRSQVPEKEVTIPIEWYTPDSIITRYASDILVQHSDHEFVISFWELHKPIVLGNEEEEIIKQLEGIKSVKKECVARVVVAPERMESFIKALQNNFAKFRSKQAQPRGEE